MDVLEGQNVYLFETGGGKQPNNQKAYYLTTPFGPKGPANYNQLIIPVAARSRRARERSLTLACRVYATKLVLLRG